MYLFKTVAWMEILLCFISKHLNKHVAQMTILQLSCEKKRRNNRTDVRQNSGLEIFQMNTFQ